MKVGFDIRPALYNRAGVGRYARELALELTRRQDGPFLELYGYSWVGNRMSLPPLTENRYRIHRGVLPARVMRHLHRLPGMDAGRHPAKVDVFHWTDYVYPSVKSAASVMTLHDAAFAVDPTFHGWNTSELLDRVRQALQQADLVVVVSEPGVQDAELFGIARDKIRVVPNGVNPIFTPGDFDPSQGGYLLTVGTIEPRKNYRRSLVALEELWDKDAAPDWVIVGRVGWEQEEFLDSMEKSRHRNRIRWVNMAEDNELLGLYRNALALLYPSLHEGFGLPVLEAMACRIPVIVGKETAPAWVAGKGGMLVDPRNVDSIAEGIERIVNEDWWRKQAAHVLHLRSREFTWERAASATLGVYQDAIEHFQSRS